ncbi:MAG: glycoside hydrolase family 3 C-terminal domain-containing protein [Prevotella sp.]|nr:glycoside hydrolase family 3 C-terminal domain-containing protein [Prevotella sp.]
MKKTLMMSALMLTMTTTTMTAQVYLDPQASMEERVKDALSRMTTHEKIQVIHAQSKFTSAGVPRLGIRQLNMDDGPHGVREELEWNTWNPARWTNDSIVAFPSLTCLASTWNRDLSRLYGHSVSEEFAFRGKDVMLGPGVNIARTPMNGRAFEYMGEDPYLAGAMVVPYIQAAQKNGVACCLKHFVLNDQETNRFGVNVNVSDRALREIYLAPFRRAVEEAHVWSIMGSYNLYKGVHCCHNDELINGILKGEWKWDGSVISDWGGTTDTWQAATGGLDIEMGSFTDGKVKESEFTYDDYYMARPLEQLINKGKIPMSVLDEKAGRVLRLIFRTAMNPKKAIGNQCSEAHYDACRAIAEEGIVLLKNETHPQPLPKGGESGKILPIDFSKYKNVLVVGENATRSLTQGGGSSELKTLRDVSPLEAIRDAWQQANSNKSPSLGEGLGVGFSQGYTSGRALYDQVDTVDPAENERLKSEALEKARQADLIIYIGGLNKNTKQDCENGDRESYDLSFGQNELISQLAQIQPNIVVVTFGGNAYATPWLQQVKALVHCWYLGSESGTALTGVLTGKVCPSGKLPVTFAKRYEDYPYVRYGEEAYQSKSSEVTYKEGIYVGYRGFDRDKTQPLFPFGYGLSYTTFQYGQPTAQVSGDQVSVEVTVRNTGSVAGKEVAQVYVSAPKNKQMDKPVKELKGFAKTRLLQSGESETLRISIPRSELASWNETTHQWQVDSGTYTLQVGASSADIRGKAKISL